MKPYPITPSTCPQPHPCLTIVCNNQNFNYKDYDCITETHSLPHSLLAKQVLYLVFNCIHIKNTEE